ncbi:hypothetical protein AA0119_g6249 [Alternaria tenuissima]|uniref:Heterokaryon incompatibility domain-containing protein n=1 Tax=Alternaria tenuissima TaxID=119927 RepID=A0ABY0G8X8_9PLEO|nr:hypothetical protein AA0119_g6249 [Alternaria tenuissima]
MEPDLSLTAASKSSLIVSLRYQPLCAQCADMLLRWCEPPARQRWTWTIDELMQGSSTCRCCRFLAQVLVASPWIKPDSHRNIVVETRIIGHQRMTKAPDHSVSKPYYRPMLYVDDDIWFDFKRKTFILPVSRVHDASSDELDSHIFCGRPVNAMVDLSLIASWHKICTSRHEDSADGYGCCPNTYESLQEFRVIDVQQRCVIKTSDKVDYAALSYVWGNAKRLVLSKDNEAWLTTPGALAQTEKNVPKTFRDALEVAAALGIANLWVDAICIDQSNSEQVKHHMDAMDKIYGSAVLTIVATAENADFGLPGISLPRGPPQAVFQYNGAHYLSSKLTFGVAMERCPWERRAWCLQEKLFSARLLVFTDTQVFYYCGVTTWFEDTIMEIPESNPDTVLLEERASFGEPYMLSYLHHTAYETHYIALGDWNFWQLVQNYSRREMTLKADVISAFAGILRSVEAEHGCAIWGIPQYHFLQGLLWYHYGGQMSFRREGFPSWSWVGWCTNGNDLYFADCKRKKTNMGVIDGQYRVARGKHNGRYVWDVHWHYYTEDEHSRVMRLRAVQLEHPDHNGAPHASSPTITAVSCTEPKLSRRAKRHHKRFDEWGLPSHPGTMKPIDVSMPLLAPGPEMPPLSHIIRSYTSVATVLVHPDENNCYDRPTFRLLVPGTEIEIAGVDLDPRWPGIGKTHSLVYLSRFYSYDDRYQEPNDDCSEELYLLLVESVPGWGEVKRRVELVQRVSILDWRKANPRWELVSLA